MENQVDQAEPFEIVDQTDLKEAVVVNMDFGDVLCTQGLTYEGVPAIVISHARAQLDVAPNIEDIRRPQMYPGDIIIKCPDHIMAYLLKISVSHLHERLEKTLIEGTVRREKRARKKKTA